MKVKLTTTIVEGLHPREDKPYEVLDTDVPGFRVRVQPNGTKLYYIRYTTRNGRRSAYPIGDIQKVKLAEARDIAREKLAEVVKGGDPCAELRVRRATLTLGEFIDGDYAESHLTTKRSGTATQARLNAAFKAWLNSRMDHITPAMVEKWRAERLAKGKATATVNRDVTSLKAALNKAKQWGLLASNPLDSVKPLKVDTRWIVRYLTSDEETALMKALDTREERICKERDRANKWRRDRDYPELPDLRHLPFADFLKPLVIVSLNTGLRRGEAFGLTWDDIDLDRATLTVRGENAKSGATRHVPLNSVALRVLKDWRSQSGGAGHVFPSPVTGERLDNCNTAWANVLDIAKIEDFRWHDMRHHFASRLVMAGVDLNTVRDLLGHAGITMTLRYAHLAPAVRANAVERLVPAKGKIVAFDRGRRRG